MTPLSDACWPQLVYCGPSFARRLWGMSVIFKHKKRILRSYRRACCSMVRILRVKGRSWSSSITTCGCLVSFYMTCGTCRENNILRKLLRPQLWSEIHYLWIGSTYKVHTFVTSWVSLLDHSLLRSYVPCINAISPKHLHESANSPLEYSTNFGKHRPRKYHRRLNRNIRKIKIIREWQRTWSLTNWRGEKGRDRDL